MSPLTSLPLETQLNIYSQLDPISKVKVSMTCKTIQTIVNNKIFNDKWEELINPHISTYVSKHTTKVHKRIKFKQRLVRIAFRIYNKFEAFAYRVDNGVEKEISLLENEVDELKKLKSKKTDLKNYHTLINESEKKKINIESQISSSAKNMCCNASFKLLSLVCLTTYAAFQFL